jgi:threonylcarbamoyladenosine tRNA methylthiotransferase MtaB
MSDQVPGTVKSERVSQLAQVESQLRQDFFQRLIGRKLRVLVESPHRHRPGTWQGTSCRYAPVDLAAPADASGTLVDAVPTRVVDGHLVV